MDKPNLRITLFQATSLIWARSLLRTYRGVVSRALQSVSKLLVEPCLEVLRPARSLKCSARSTWLQSRQSSSKLNRSEHSAVGPEPNSQCPSPQEELQTPVAVVVSLSSAIKQLVPPRHLRCRVLLVLPRHLRCRASLVPLSNQHSALVVSLKCLRCSLLHSLCHLPDKLHSSQCKASDSQQPSKVLVVPLVASVVETCRLRCSSLESDDYSTQFKLQINFFVTLK